MTNYYTIDNETKTIKQWAKHHGISLHILTGRFQTRPTLEECFPNNWIDQRNQRNQDKLWVDEKYEDLVQMSQNGHTLQQMGEHFGVTKQRIHQILTKFSLVQRRNKRKEQFETVTNLAKLLGTGSKIILELVEEDEFYQSGEGLLISKLLIPTIKERLNSIRTYACEVCKNDFISKIPKVLYCKNCRKKAHQHKIAYSHICGWHRETIQRLMVLNIVDTWVHIADASRSSGLSVMQAGWLIKKRIVRIRYHATELWRGQPVQMCNLTEMFVAGEAYKECKKENTHKKMHKVTPKIMAFINRY